MGHLHGILLASVLIDDVVSHGAVFIGGLRAALPHGVQFGLGATFYAVTQDGATHGAHNGGRSGCRTTPTRRTAQRATCNGPDGGTRAGFGLLNRDLLVIANLVWNRNLLHHGCGRQNPPEVNRAGIAACAQREQKKNGLFFHGLNPLVVANPIERPIVPLTRKTVYTVDSLYIRHQLSQSLPPPESEEPASSQLVSLMPKSCPPMSALVSTGM